MIGFSVHDSSAGGHLRGQNFSLSDVMDTWIRQAHFPVIHVNRKEGSLVTLRQEKYEVSNWHRYHQTLSKTSARAS